MALDLTKSGAQVIISARRESQLEEVANACEKVGIRPFVVPLDVTNFEAQKVAYDQIMERFGRFVALCHADKVYTTQADSKNLVLQTNSILFVYQISKICLCMGLAPM